MGHNSKILVVDDDVDIRDALTWILESQGYQVITAHDGLEGLSRVEEEKPDLVILDLIMPNMDGFTMFKELKDNPNIEYANIPVLILTSLREDYSRTRFELETGVPMTTDGYAEKPISPPVILQRVQKLLEKDTTLTS